MRGSIIIDSNGNSVAKKFERDGSGLITGLRESMGLIEIPETTTAINQGDMIDFIPFYRAGSIKHMQKCKPSHLVICTIGIFCRYCPNGSGF